MKKRMTPFFNLFFIGSILTAASSSCVKQEPPVVEALTIDDPFPQINSPRVTQEGTPNLIHAARLVTSGVVHVKTLYRGGGQPNRLLGDLYGQENAPSIGSGSGVIISPSGYVATNNHVVENSSDIQVVLADRRSYAAELIGRDPTTDIALLKIEAENLPFVALGNSDSSQIGEWVLAVGYPYSMNTTVTAGIISAKGRSLGIIGRSLARGPDAAQVPSAIESFIQTDAAINPGNSGGALVNMNGELIGINTAIASLTGSYAGYGFAVPVNLAKKILDDLKEFGEVRRGILGVSFPSPIVEDQVLQQQGIDPGTIKGVLITGIQRGGAADEAGLREGDIIKAIDSVDVFTSAEFTERIGRHRPGDKISVEYLRKNTTHNAVATLKAAEKESVASSESLNAIYERLGAKFSPLTSGIKQRYNLSAGVLVTEVKRGGIFDMIGIPSGTVIIYINGKAMNTPEDIDNALVEARNSKVQILGIAPDGSRIAFDFSLGA
jgi:Do/DeqQ family serine protease